MVMPTGWCSRRGAALGASRSAPTTMFNNDARKSLPATITGAGFELFGDLVGDRLAAAVRKALFLSLLGPRRLHHLADKSDNRDNQAIRRCAPLQGQSGLVSR